MFSALPPTPDIDNAMACSKVNWRIPPYPHRVPVWPQERRSGGNGGAPSRIKQLRGLRRSQYRVDDIRVFYDVSGTTVEILSIVSKLEAESWLAQFGSPE
jgi:hypothetical protein